MSGDHESCSNYVSSAIQELVFGLGSTSGRTQLMIIGDSIDPAPFRTKFDLTLRALMVAKYMVSITHRAIVLWLMSAESVPAGETLSRTIVDCYHRDAIIVRISVPSEDLNNPFLRGNFLQAFEQQVDVKPIFLSLLLPVNTSVVSESCGTLRSSGTI